MYLTYYVHLVGIKEVIQRFCCSNDERNSSFLLPAPQIFLIHQITNTSPAITRSHRISSLRTSPLCEGICRIAIELQSCRKQCPVWQRPGHSWQWQSLAAANDRYTSAWQALLCYEISYPGLNLIRESDIGHDIANYSQLNICLRNIWHKFCIWCLSTNSARYFLTHWGRGF